jgi:flagellar biogenesis protein FliO
VDVLLQALSNPDEMSRMQWLLMAILAFIVVGSAYFVWKLYAIIKGSRKSAYVPNIGLKRLQKEAAEAQQSRRPGQAKD